MANGYGLYDMSGNVEEWCWDVDPDHSSEFRHYFGGSWRGDARTCQVYHSISPSSRYNDLGFRLVRSESNIEIETIMPTVEININKRVIAVLETEVTQKLYTSIMGSNPSKFRGDNNPVENVSWYYAIYFCNKLSEKCGFTPVYEVDGITDVTKWNYTPHERKIISLNVMMNSFANGFRLPTVEEWQFAAKGGQNYKYSGSNDIDEVAWYDGNSGDTTHPVAQKKANGYGLYDMHGNVWEWCWDLNPRRGSHYCCGGNWCYSARDCQVDNGYNYWPDIHFDYLGFRVVRSLSN